MRKRPAAPAWRIRAGRHRQRHQRRPASRRPRRDRQPLRRRPGAAAPGVRVAGLRVRRRTAHRPGAAPSPAGAGRDPGVPVIGRSKTTSTSTSTTAPSSRLGPRPGPRGWVGRGRGPAGYLQAPDEWRGTTVQVCGLWPFAAGTGSPMVGVPVGRNMLSGSTLCCDPVWWFQRGNLISQPSMFVLGRPGLGKSTIVRRMALGLAGYACSRWCSGTCARTTSTSSKPSAGRSCVWAWAGVAQRPGLRRSQGRR